MLHSSSTAMGLVGTFLFLSSVFMLAPSSSSYELDTQLGSRRLLQNNIIQQFLVPHNKARAGLGLPPLRWSTKLANYASWWANQRRGDCAMIHSNGNYGENIFWGAGRNWKPVDAVGAWAAESRFYNYGLNSCQPYHDCLHYTQLMWKKSSKVGCAQVGCGNGDTYVVCNYDPHGNIIGQKPY